MKPYVAKVHVPIYNWTVYFSHDAKATAAWMKRKNVCDETVAHWDTKDGGGCTTSFTKWHEAYIGIFSKGRPARMATLAHECTHAAMDILERANVPVTYTNNEALAYLVGFLVNQYLSAISK